MKKTVFIACAIVGMMVHGAGIADGNLLKNGDF